MRSKAQPQVLLLLSLPQHYKPLIAQLLKPSWAHPVLLFHQNCVTTQTNLCPISADTFKRVLVSSGSSSAAEV